MKAKNENGWTHLHNAAYGGNVAAVKALIKSGADLNANDEDGWTLLHSAVWNGHTDAVGVLVEAGADPSAKTDAW